MDRRTAKLITAECIAVIAEDLLAQCRKLGIGGRADINGTSCGKRMGKSVYVHQSYEDLLDVDDAKAKLPGDFEYAVVKLDEDSGCVSFIESKDFDEADEPTVGRSARVCGDEVTWRNPSDDPQIYHHKWMMVGEDYDGFDVVESMRRSIAWKSIVGKDAKLSSRIGKKSVWESEVVPKLATSARKVTAYHGGNKPIRRFSRDYAAMGVFWFSEDKDKILHGESGAASTKYIMTVELNIKKTAGWDEYGKLLLAQIRNDGYNSIKLDDDWVMFDPKDIKVKKIETREEAEQSIAYASDINAAAVPSSVQKFITQIEEKAGLTAVTEVSSDNFRMEFKRGSSKVGYFRVSTVNTSSFMWNNAPQECKDAWERLGHPTLWAVRGAEWFDKDLIGKGLGSLAYEALFEFVRSKKGVVGPDICAGESTSNEAKKVWDRLYRKHRSEGPLVILARESPNQYKKRTDKCPPGYRGNEKTKCIDMKEVRKKKAWQRQQMLKDRREKEKKERARERKRSKK